MEFVSWVFLWNVANKHLRAVSLSSHPQIMFLLHLWNVLCAAVTFIQVFARKSDSAVPNFASNGSWPRSSLLVSLDDPSLVCFSYFISCPRFRSAWPVCLLRLFEHVRGQHHIYSCCCLALSNRRRLPSPAGASPSIEHQQPLLLWNIFTSCSGQD